jgi:hypothetical protein
VARQAFANIVFPVKVASGRLMRGQVMGDFIDEDYTRTLQSDPKVVQNYWQKLMSWGHYNIVKVMNAEPSPPAIRMVSGYAGRLTVLSGKTPAEMRDMLGLRIVDLADGAAIYQLTKVPNTSEFAVRGVTSLVDGKRLKPGLRQDSHGYRPGQSEEQFMIFKDKPIEAKLFAVVRPGERFVIPPHPGIRYR